MPRTTGPRHRLSPASVHGRQPRGQRPRHTWPEVPDADGSETLEEAGDARDPMASYETSRSRKLSTRAFLKGRDLIDARQAAGEEEGQGRCPWTPAKAGPLQS